MSRAHEKFREVYAREAAALGFPADVDLRSSAPVGKALDAALWEDRQGRVGGIGLAQELEQARAEERAPDPCGHPRACLEKRSQTGHGCMEDVAWGGPCSHTREVCRWCEREAALRDQIERAWVVIANVGGGDWTREGQDWQAAAHFWGVYAGYRQPNPSEAVRPKVDAQPERYKWLEREARLVGLLRQVLERHRQGSIQQTVILFDEIEAALREREKP